MSKHTPGPWIVEGADVWATKPVRFTTISAGTPKIAIVCQHQDAENFPAQANARLIAAAPELLEALAALHEASNGCSDAEITARLQARAAIAKATGEDQ